MATTRKTSKARAVSNEVGRVEREALDALLEDDANTTPTPPPDLLARITGAGADLLALRQRIARGEALLEELKKAERNLCLNILPPLMDEATLKELTLVDDYSITRTENVYASITKANKAEATQWLESHGYGDLVKYSLTLPLTRGDKAGAAKVRALLTKAKVEYVEESSVHAQTLLAFVKESIREVRPLPASISVHTEPAVQLVMKKSKR